MTIRCVSSANRFDAGCAAIRRAAETIRNEAACLRECHTVGGVWKGEDEVHRQYDAMLSQVNDLGRFADMLEAGVCNE